MALVGAINWRFLLRMNIIYPTLPPALTPWVSAPTTEEFAMSRIRQAARQNKTMLMKTGSYYVLHIGVAALVAYAVTGNFWASLTLSLLEPTVQAVAFFFHEKAWERKARRASAANTVDRSPSLVPSAR
jgi:uncharacterized membrane protein